MNALGPGSGRLILVGAILGAAGELAAESGPIATSNMLVAGGLGALLGWCAWLAVTGTAAAVGYEAAG